VERNRITPAILIDFQSGGFWGASPPQNPERLWKIVTIKGKKGCMGGWVKIGGKNGSIFNGNLHRMSEINNWAIKPIINAP